MNARGNNMSILYLALVCVLYYLLISGALSPNTAQPHTNHTLYVEIVRNGLSTIHPLNNPNAIADIANKYSVDINDGTKLILEHNNNINIARISGIKSISLGVPIGLNSATEEDLTALPGIGRALSERIVAYRESSGGFKSLSELDNVEGIGEKTLKSLDGKISLY